LLDELTGELGVGFSAGDFHDLTAEEAGGGLGLLGVAGKGVGDGLGVGGEGFVDPFFEGAGVSLLDEAERLGDVASGLALTPALSRREREKFFGDLQSGAGADRTIGDEGGEFGNRLRNNAEAADREILRRGDVVPDAEELLGEDARVGARLDRVVEELAGRGIGENDFAILGGQAVIADEAGLFAASVVTGTRSGSGK